MKWISILFEDNGYSEEERQYTLSSCMYLLPCSLMLYTK